MKKYSSKKAGKGKLKFRTPSGFISKKCEAKRKFLKKAKEK
ncbi:MAG: hypothetical protein U9Q96_02145 [Patescibacteria group bacterium]|nr:hypothetical protein [Patescibacteria group bacterium]